MGVLPKGHDKNQAAMGWTEDGSQAACELDKQICASCLIKPCWCLRLLLFLLSHE